MNMKVYIGSTTGDDYGICIIAARSRLEARKLMEDAKISDNFYYLVESEDLNTDLDKPRIIHCALISWNGYEWEINNNGKVWNTK